MDLDEKVNLSQGVHTHKRICSSIVSLICPPKQSRTRRLIQSFKGRQLFSPNCSSSVWRQEAAQDVSVLSEITASRTAVLSELSRTVFKDYTINCSHVLIKLV